jgi:hypothetical protein
MLSWSSPRTARTIYLVPALDGERFLAVRGKLSLAAWPLERRIVGPWSERADHLRATIQLASQLAWLSGVEPESAERLRKLVASYASSIPGSVIEGELLDSARVEEAAQAELNIIREQDARWRAEAAERARRLLGEEQLLWGASLPRVVHGGI